MFNDPGIGKSITLDGEAYSFTEAPNAPGIIYAEIGRKAKVYRVMSNGKAYALKAFKPKYRSLETVENTQRIAAFRDVPGLSVARRLVIDPDKYRDIIKKHEAFAYAILMPWVEGKCWFNNVTGKVAISRQESLRLARALVNAVCELEQRDMAHCDLSSSNFIFSPDFNHVELIDIEDMFGHDLEKPVEKPKGTGGYAPNWVKSEGVWEAGADRYSTGILVSEILGWQFDDIRSASAGDAFFAEGEFGNKSKRFRLLSERLEQINPELSRLFKTVWYAESVEECPRIADWKRIFDSLWEPELQVAPEFLEFGVLDLSIKPAVQPQKTIKVLNTGGGMLTGQVTSNTPWLIVTPAKFSLAEGQESAHSVILAANAPTSKDRKSYPFRDGITVHSNAHDQSLSGSYTVVLPKFRFPKWAYAVGALMIAICVIISGVTIIGLFSHPASQNTPVSAVTNFPTLTRSGTTQVVPSVVPSAVPSVVPMETPTPTDTPVYVLVPGSTKTNPKDGMLLLYIPEGNFTMGDSANTALAECLKASRDCPYDWFTDEAPAHKVYLSAFWIDKSEVTNAMYALCVKAGVCLLPDSSSSRTRFSYFGNSQFANYPVIYVTWYDANTYCSWAGQRLPSEAEWEKAARGTDERMYPWGNSTPNCSIANYYPINHDPCKGDTTEVDSYPANVSPYGVLNMAGNVWEWTADWYSDTFYSSSPQSDPHGPASGTKRIMRGGAWSFYENVLRSTNRHGDVADHSDDSLGFRCVQDINP